MRNAIKKKLNPSGGGKKAAGVGGQDNRLKEGLSWVTGEDYRKAPGDGVQLVGKKKKNPPKKKKRKRNHQRGRCWPRKVWLSGCREGDPARQTRLGAGPAGTHQSEWKDGSTGRSENHGNGREGQPKKKKKKKEKR